MGTRVARRALRRAATAATALVLASATFASADSLVAGGDVVSPGAAMPIDLGAVAPGAMLTVDVPFFLACTNSSHVNRNQVVTITPAFSSIDGDGSVAATGTTIGPPPATWPLDGDACTAANTPIQSNGPASITIVAPPDDGTDYLVQVAYTRSFSPQSANDGTAVSGTMFTFVTLSLDVGSNTPPTLVLPSAVTVEGDSTGGAVAAYTVGATDAEDDPDPTPACSPAPGTFVPLGTTLVDCTVTDGGGLSASGSFDLTVVDTIAPTLTNVPPGLDLVTSDPAGAVLAYALPTATDVVDPDPTVVCTPSPGETVPVGDSTVACTATDDGGNASEASFPVHVALGSTMSARWESPVGGDPASLVANHGRTIPVKLALFDGPNEVRSGPVWLTVAPCAGGEVLATVALGWSGGRLLGHLDTSVLPGAGCYTVMAAPDGGVGPSFTLDVRGPDQASAPGRAKRA
jgi:hypothetical protein